MRVLPLALAAALSAPAAARTLTVGADGMKTLADAVAAAADGDTIHLPPGEYYECAVLARSGLVLEGEGAGTVLTDRTCEGKAILIARGDGLTIRNLVLARARVPDDNGAGIRLEAQGLVLDGVRFRNDQAGLLAAQPGSGSIRIRGCTFEGGGVGGPHPTAALSVDAVGLLQVINSTFEAAEGDQIRTEAAQTELTGNRIETGANPDAGAAVLASGGALRMDGNTVGIGPNPPPRGAAVVVTAGTAELRNNRLLNASGKPAVLLLNWTRHDAVLSGNQVPQGDAETSSAGLWRHRLGGAAHGLADGARHLAGAAKRALLGALGR